MATSQRTHHHLEGRRLTRPGRRDSFEGRVNQLLEWFGQGVPPPLFTTVRVLEQAFPEAPRIGEDGPLRDEKIYFRHSPSFASHPRELESVSWTRVVAGAEDLLADPQRRFEVTTLIFGLSGADSPLPLYAAEELLVDSDEAEALRAFFDIFHNRLTALLYRSVSKLQYHREYRSDGDDPGSRRLLAFAGQDRFGPRRSEGLSGNDWLRVCSLLAGGATAPRSVRNALQSVLRPLLADTALRIEQFTGGWVRYEASQTNRLGQRNNEAGQSFIIGTRIRHPAHQARIVIGPMLPGLAQRVAPPSNGFDRVCSVLGSMAPAAIRYELELLVEEAALPPFLLGQRRLAQDVCLVARPTRSRVTSRRYDVPT